MLLRNCAKVSSGCNLSRAVDDVKFWLLRVHSKRTLTASGSRNDFPVVDHEDVKLFGNDIRGHTRGTLVVGIAYGCAYCKGSAMFSLVFLSTTSEKSFIPYKPSAAVQALKVCPVRPRVLSSWGITLLE